jgi:SNF2 family DNA or RNA helicase
LLEEACRQRQIPTHGLAGQTQTVNAYRLISPGTVEEKFWELQQSKAQPIADVLGEEGFARSLSKADLEYLFSED